MYPTRLHRIAPFGFGSWLARCLGDANSFLVVSLFSLFFVYTSSYLDANFDGMDIPTRLMRIGERTIIKYTTAETKSGAIAIAIS